MSDTVRCIRFNSTQDCFAVGTDEGLRVFSCCPLSEICYLRKSQVGSVKICAFYRRSNLYAIVSGGVCPKFAENAVMVWDEVKKDFVLEVTVSSAILNLFMTQTHLVLVEARLVHVFCYPKNVERLQHYESAYNPVGVADVIAEGRNEYLAFPATNTGSVQIVDLNKVAKGSSLSPVIIKAHTSDIARLALNNQGTILATGSVKGTVIRLFDVRSQRLLYFFRRGSDPAALYCLRFSPCSCFLGVYSDKGTVHIFTLGKQEDNKWTNRKSFFHSMGLTPEDAERSCAQFSLSEGKESAELAFHNCSPMGSPQKSNLNSQQYISAVCSNGTFHRYLLASDGTCTREGFDSFLDLGDEQHFWVGDF